MLPPAAAQETLPAAGAMGVSESVVVDTQVMTQTPLTPFSIFIKILCWDLPPLRC